MAYGLLFENTHCKVPNSMSVVFILLVLNHLKVKVDLSVHYHKCLNLNNEIAKKSLNGNSITWDGPYLKHQFSAGACTSLRVLPHSYSGEEAGIMIILTKTQ